MTEQGVVTNAPATGAMPMTTISGSQREEQVPQTMERPAAPLGCPPGLEYLTMVDQILVKQLIELLEVLTGWETNNKYVIMNTLGQQVYFAAEDTGLCMRLFCGAARGFTIHIIDNLGQEVMTVRREFKCCAGCCWCANAKCCYFEAVIEAPPGVPIGYARQSQSKWRPMFKLLTADLEEIAYIRGPCCPCGCRDVNFPVFSSKTNEEIGCVTKQWTGFISEAFTDADNFSISFPMDMDVKMKAVFMGALFLIDFMYFETDDNDF